LSRFDAGLASSDSHVSWRTVYLTDAAKAPWGGFKYSGVGREYGQYGIEAFVETGAILEP
jgi:acyl-CoA reductase-like NAD-dependent aldehyde dehydrogenase